MSCNVCGAAIDEAHAPSCRHFDRNAAAARAAMQRTAPGELVAERLARLELQMKTIEEWAEREGVAWVFERLKSIRKGGR